MSPVDTRDALEAGFVPSELPPKAADGGLELTPAPVRLPIVQPISLCELGPCRRLHVMEQKIDAQAPLDGTEAPIATMTIRTCYPSAGIEYDLTGEPIKACNRWDPPMGSSNYTHGLSQYSEEYLRFLESWKAAPEPPK